MRAHKILKSIWPVALAGAVLVVCPKDSAFAFQDSSLEKFQKQMKENEQGPGQENGESQNQAPQSAPAPESSPKNAPTTVSPQETQASLGSIFDRTLFTKEEYLAYSPLHLQMEADKSAGKGSFFNRSYGRSRAKPERWTGRLLQDSWAVGKVALPMTASLAGWAAGPSLASGLLGKALGGLLGFVGYKATNSMMNGNLIRRFGSTGIDRKNMLIGGIGALAGLLLSSFFGFGLGLPLIGMIGLPVMNAFQYSSKARAQRQAAQNQEDMLVV